MSMSCEDPHCGDPDHSSDRDSVVLDILCSVVESSHSVIPMAGGSKTCTGRSKSGLKSVSVPGWDKEVQPFQEDARFWHAIWISAGKPNKGDLHTAMARSRNQLHYAVMRTCRSEELQQSNNLFHASLTCDFELIKEMKKIKSGCRATTELTDNVVGAEGEFEIVEKFKEVYSALYNSAGTADEVATIKEKLQELIKNDSMDEVMRITGEKVKEADVSGGFASDAILNGPDILFDQLACVDRSWCVHGTVTGSNFALLRRETGLDPVLSSIGRVKEQLLKGVCKVPDIDQWRLDYLASLLSVRGE